MNKRATLLLLLFSPIAAMALSVSIWEQGPSLCGNDNGYATAYASGGTPPYNYFWSNGANTSGVQGLAPGTYTVTVTDAVMDEATAQVTIIEGQTTLYLTFSGAGLHGCNGLCNGGRSIHASMLPLNLVPPLSFSPPLSEDYNGQGGDIYGLYTGLCPGQELQFTVTDATGCQVQVIDSWMPESSSATPMSILGVTPACGTFATGSVTINAGLDVVSPFGPIWEVVILDEAMQQVGSPISGLSTQPDLNVATRGGLTPGNYFAKRYFAWHPEDCQDMVPFTIADLGTDCGLLSGTAFVDHSLDCTRLTNEPWVPNAIMEVLPGPYYATTNTNGQYSMVLTPGAYTVQQQSSILDEHCVGAPIPFTITNGATATVHHPDTALVPLDVMVSLHSGAARPGFQFDYAMSVRNLTPAGSGAISITLTFDPTITFLSATPPPSNVSGNTLTWNQAQLAAWQLRGFTIRFQIPPNVGLLGYELIATATVTTTNTDSDLTNNTATNSRIITGAYDPNDKLAYTSMGNTSLWQINEDQWIDYTIRFQNTGTDTAFTVVITDTLPSNLDPSTIVMGAATHPFSWELREQGTLRFLFPNILLPDSNVNEPASNGFVGFRIRPHLPLLPGDEITNIANIYFDFNPPVITEPSVLVATTGTGVVEQPTSNLRLAPNPAQDAVEVLGFVGDVQQARIFSAEGRLARTFGPAQGRNRFPLQGLGAGTYILELTPLAGTPIRLPLIISHH